MGKTDFTPGPWRYRPSEFKGDFIISGSNEHGVDVLPILGRTHNWPRYAEANARLIAAAPELYEALEGAEKIIEQLVLYVVDEGRMAGDENGDDEWFAEHGQAALTSIRGALAHARGETPDER